MRLAPFVAAGVCAVSTASVVHAATIDVSPTDDYKKIEAAVAGDTVVFAPGTYKFRVYLSNSGTAASPIVLKAKDPKNPPVFDLGGKNVEAWPGSYTGGDNGRGCIQVAGAYYDISGLVLTNCKTASQNAAGLRFIGAKNLTLRDIVFRKNEMGLTGDGENVLVEHCEMDSNGNTTASFETHNLYIYGGSFTLRYSYLHDATHGQNFHLRCVDCLLENNWIARAQNYEGDLMPTDPAPASQKLVLRGNVIVQATKPENGGQIIAPFNDTGATGLSFTVEMYWNTIIGNGGDATLLQFNNAGLAKTIGVLSNNVVVGNKHPHGSTDGSKTTISGTHNWFVTGATPIAGLAASVFGTTPGVDAKYRPTAGSALITAADTTVSPAPGREYYLDETTARMYRPRLTAKDIGAFESTTTGEGYGPYGGPLPPTDAGTDSGSDATPTDSSVPFDAVIDTYNDYPKNPPADSTGDSGGCGCTTPGTHDARDSFALLAALIGAGALWSTRRR